MDSTTTPTVAPAQELIDPYAMERIEFKVRELALAFELSEEDQEDYRNDMVVELLTAFKRFNPKLAKRETFINRVLQKFLLNAMRVRCTRQRRACDSPTGLEDVNPGFEPAVNDARKGERDEQAQVELRLDLETVIARMPRNLQEICRLLMVLEPKEAARRLGMHPRSIYPLIRQIRGHLEAAGLNKFENSRD